MFIRYFYQYILCQHTVNFSHTSSVVIFQSPAVPTLIKVCNAVLSELKGHKQVNIQREEIHLVILSVKLQNLLLSIGGQGWGEGGRRGESRGGREGGEGGRSKGGRIERRKEGMKEINEWRGERQEREGSGESEAGREGREVQGREGG